MSEVIFKDDEKSKIVMDYTPKKISSPISREAESFLLSQPTEQKTSFRMSDLIAQQTGIHELERASIERRIEQKALERLKEIQEEAYRQAYELGLQEGTQKGHEEAKKVVQQRLGHLNNLIERLTRIKTEILQRNEIQIIDFLYLLATRIAYFEIDKKPDRIVPVLKTAMESLQKDESMTIKVSPHDIAQVEELKKISGSAYEFLEKAKFEAHEEIQPGGCVIETNYGLIDATIEERVERLREYLDENKPMTKRDDFE